MTTPQNGERRLGKGGAATIPGKTVTTCQRSIFDELDELNRTSRANGSGGGGAAALCVLACSAETVCPRTCGAVAPW